MRSLGDNPAVGLLALGGTTGKASAVRSEQGRAGLGLRRPPLGAASAAVAALSSSPTVVASVAARAERRFAPGTQLR